MEVMARYGYGDADVAWKMGRIMQKFRPIAPKPAGGSGAAAVTARSLNFKSSSGSGRGKRKSRNGSNHSKRGRKPNKKVATGAFLEGNYSASQPPAVVTLPLMPVTPERKDESPATPSPTGSDGHVPLSYFGRSTWTQATGNNSSNNGAVVTPRPVRPVGSWVTVECVTDTWRAGDASPASPADLETDACPVFISDACDRVTWSNAAYKKMVVGPREEGDGAEEEQEEEVMRVALVTRGLAPAAEDGRVTCFTCMVRVRYACRRKGKVSLAAPCDVWRLADGRLAWRLDIKAALSLSLGS